MAKSKDLFDDSVMTFGEHLEVLRTHLWKALIGLSIGVCVALYFGDGILAVVRSPIDKALTKYGVAEAAGIDHSEGYGFTDAWDYLVSWFEATEEVEQKAKNDQLVSSAEDQKQTGAITVYMHPSALAAALNRVDPEKYPALEPKPDEEPIALVIWAEEFARFIATSDKIDQPITLTVQEAFMTYLKVSFVGGLVLTSPWVFYQLWLFVASGLYPHERRYVYVYLPMTLGLFIGGAVFCFYAVFPFVLDFLLGFNAYLGVTPQIRLSEWISFAIFLPLMFGLSFELPVVMLFLERISVFDVATYREKRRMAILVISVISMMLTPADPMSMLAMMFPLIILYEVGILMCSYSPAKSPFETEAV